MPSPCFAAAIGLIGLVMPDPAAAQTRESRSVTAAPRVAAEGAVPAPAVRSGLAYRATMEWMRPLAVVTGTNASGRIDRRLTAITIDELGNASIKQDRAGVELAGASEAGLRFDLPIGLNF
ncbi:hypothetical protein R5H32_00335 [Defluviimonas sp. D31]|uniref:hypothetical protein n=1 Tax=Defluviimonas sp. D31 TaxID=3083253 RepID=UPI00296E81F2|nr:hypothetical protein [Defluviimonas sp. D31]MDW4547789.1 hypothetical protein [Defluviimonas sp. D31]